MYRHSKYESVNAKGEIKQLQKYKTDKINRLTEIDELKTENLKQTKVNHAQIDEVNKCKEFIENLRKEVNEQKHRMENSRQKWHIVRL